MAQYMPLDSQNEVHNHLNDDRAWEWCSIIDLMQGVMRGIVILSFYVQQKVLKGRNHILNDLLDL